MTLDKKLHGLRATLRENGTAINLQKKSPEEIEIIIVGNDHHRYSMTATVTQLREAVNKLDLWDKAEVVKDAD